jgi:hypothetical protein
MLQDQEGLYGLRTPLVFTDGTETYNEVAKEFIRHKKGFFILGPSGIGKSHYIRNQSPNEKHWIDADWLWRLTRAMPVGAWWEKIEDIIDVEQRCDIITAESKRQGFWMLGSSCNWYTPDAIVVPRWQTNVKFVKIREKNYDGGITTERLPQLKAHRKEILGWQKKGVPRFYSVPEAIEYLESKYKKEFDDVNA